MANTFPVAESPLDFTRAIAPYVRHCHVKDYRAVIEPDGFRLVRVVLDVPLPAVVELTGTVPAEDGAALAVGFA